MHVLFENVSVLIYSVTEYCVNTAACYFCFEHSLYYAKSSSSRVHSSWKHVKFGCFISEKNYYQSRLDWWQSLLPVRKCLGILWLQAAHVHCSQYMRIVDNMAAVHV